MLRYKFLYIIIFLLNTCFAFAQTDSTHTRGTIKISKVKEAKIYIKASMNFNDYDVSKINVPVSREMRYTPFPGVDGYTFPFNYTRYITEKFKTKEIDIRGKLSDTVRIEIKVLANGKVYLKNKSRTMLVKDLPTPYDEKVDGIEWSSLQLYSFDFIKEIKTWEPAYIAVPTKEKFKKETVIKPKITQVTASGILTIVFSSTPFEDSF